MNRREFLGTLAGAALAEAGRVVLADGGHGALLSKKPAFKHKSVEDIPVLLKCAI